MSQKRGPCENGSLNVAWEELFLRAWLCPQDGPGLPGCHGFEDALILELNLWGAVQGSIEFLIIDTNGISNDQEEMSISPSCCSTDTS